MADFGNSKFFQMAIAKKGQNSTGNVVFPERGKVGLEAGAGEFLKNFIDCPLTCVRH
jgi:hypothetical protein